MLNSWLKVKKSPFFKARSRAPGSCGELIQGYLDGEDFLINCPIDKYATATLYRSEVPGVAFYNEPFFSKAKSAVELIAQRFHLELNHYLVVDNEMIRGKGMASSTADIACAVFALCQGLEVSITNAEFTKILATVEPTDGIYFSGIAHLNQLSGSLIELFPAPTCLRVLVLDCGGYVETEQFNRMKARRVYQEHRDEVIDMIKQLKEGLKKRNNQWIGSAATLSAQLSQKILFKPSFEKLLKLSHSLGAVGVNCAHSGTVLGVLYEEQSVCLAQLILAIKRNFSSELTILGDHQVIQGGCFEH